MGKSLVCIALVLANPLTTKKPMSNAQWKESRSLITCKSANYMNTQDMWEFLPQDIQNKHVTFKSNRWNHNTNKMENYVTSLTRKIRLHEAQALLLHNGQPLYTDKANAIRSGVLQFQQHTKKAMEHNSKVSKEQEEFRQKKASACKHALTHQTYPIKTTIISTTCTLVGQWYDEIKKWAPNLIVKVYHGSFKQSHPNRCRDSEDLRQVDILLNVTTTKLPTSWEKLTFHRVIADEIHAYGVPNNHSMRVWGVTATPFESFSRIFGKLGYTSTSTGVQPRTTWNRIMSKRAPTSNDVDVINTVMIRHTKDQMIAGTAALKLPPMPKSTIVVQTTSQEKKKYVAAVSAFDVASCTGMLLKYNPKLPQAAWLDIKLHPVRSATCTQSKLKALEKDIVSLMKTQPNANVLIFTRFKSSIATLKTFRASSTVLRNMKLYEISSNNAAAQRQTSIRSFQDPQMKQSKMLIVSYKTGSCGITLTAASRVYLLEPCLLPSDEVQAGGRISRLGQTKQISLVRLVMKDTCDEGLVKMHAMLESGAAKLDSNGQLPPVLLPLLLSQGMTAVPKYTMPTAKTSYLSQIAEYTTKHNLVWSAILKLKLLSTPQSSFDSTVRKLHSTNGLVQ